MSERKKIGKRVVDEAQPPETGTAFIWDSELKGFGLRLTKGSKTYVVQSRVNGKTVRVKIGAHGHLTPDQARTLAKAKLGEMAQGVNHNQAAREERRKSITLEQAFKDFLQDRTLTKKTQAVYSAAMEGSFADWRQAQVRDINRAMIERRFDELTQRGKGLANRDFRFLRALLNFAMEKYASEDGEPLLPSNPVQRLTALKRWHRLTPRSRHVEPHQMKDWFAALAHQPADTKHHKAVKDMCAMLMLTGFRDQECAARRWEQVDMIGRKVTLPDPKNHRPHSIPIGNWLLALLRRRKAETGDSPFVFPADNKHGHVINHRNNIEALCAASGVQFSPHDLRRSFSSVVNKHLKRTLTAWDIKRLLNHKSGDVTGDYIQIGVEDLREAMQQVEDFMLKSAGLLDSAPVVELKQSRG